MISGTCHCGAVSFTCDATPDFAVRCNCSACRKLGALWVHAPIEKVHVTGETRSYAYGEKNLAFHTCLTCGATTHWSSLKPEERPHMAVNVNLAELDYVDSLRVRRFDGAKTWAFLDD